MKALRFADNQLYFTDQAELPAQAHESLVRVTMAGICNTDLEIVRGYAGFQGTLGHEFVGVVADSPDPAQIGLRVTGEINVGCGVCDLCLSGDPRHCPQRTALGIRNRDGAFAEYLSLPPENLLVVPDNVSDRQAVFTEPLAAACEMLTQVEINHHHRVAVLGDGKLGQLLARVLATTECDLTLIGRHAEKLLLAAEVGIKTTAAEYLRIGPGHRFDFVVEATGTPDGLKFALDLVKPRGAILLKSTFRGKVELDAARIVVDEISVIGSRCGRFATALQLLAEGRVDVEGLITAEYPLSEGVTAMQHAQRKGTLKVVLTNQDAEFRVMR